MRQIIIYAGLLVGIGGVAAKLADQFARTPAAAARQESYSSSVVIPADARGHFVVEARVDGRRMEFMLDTGATVVALRARDAAALGIHPVARDFTVGVKTANGTTRAAPVQLGMVEVKGLSVRNVAALVSADEAALSENLLGLSFLSRLRRFEFSNGKMVLEQ
jgi:aspartyl protease family protein